MRLGQLARKHNLPVQDIIDFLYEKTGEKFQPNARLFDKIELMVLEHFGIYPGEEATAESNESPTLEAESSARDIEPDILEGDLSPEEEIKRLGGELELAENLVSQEKDSTTQEEEKPLPAPDEVIQTDELLRLMESGDADLNLEKVKLIKAPRKELPGLKVLGKVELTEVQKKPKDTLKKTENKTKSHPKKRRELSEAEKEKRRLRAKRKKEAYEARMEKRRKAEEARRLKEKKAAHYRKKLQKTKEKKKPIAVRNEESQRPTPTPVDSKPTPKSWLGRWWRWMNS